MMTDTQTMPPPAPPANIVFTDSAATGRYRIRIDQRRPAVEADLAAVEAAQVFSAAEDLRRQGEPRRAVALYQRALDLWEELGDPRRLDALYRLGQVHNRDLGERRTAIDFYRRALPLLRDQPNPEVEASIFYGIGRCYYLLGEIERARPPYERALVLRRTLGDLRGEAVTLNNLGLVYDLSGDVPAALAAFDLALERLIRLGDRSQEATTLHNRGQTYLAVGDQEQALADLERALAIRRAAGARPRAATLTAIGRVHEKRGDLETALRCHTEALALARGAGDRHLTAVILVSMGVAFEALERTEDALRCYQRALPIFDQLGDRHDQALLHHNLGWLLASRGRSEEALGYYRQALLLKEETRDTWRLATTLWGMALAERQLGRLGAARRRIEEALDEIESLRTRPASQDQRSSFFATKQDYYDFYVDLLMELHRRDPAARHDTEALAASERARARSQLDALIETGADPWSGVDSAARERLRKLEREIGLKEVQRRRLTGDQPTNQQLAAVDRKLRELLRQHRRARSELRATGADGAELAESPLLDARDIQRRIVDDETLLLEYDLGPERSYLWAVTRDEIASFELPGQAEIEATTRRTYELLTRSQGR